MACKSVLVVEDDKDIRETLVDLLQIENYNAIGCENGKQALEALPNIAPPCLILLDLMMPIMNGWEFLTAKKGDIRLAPIPVVVVSALDRSSANVKGAFGFIRKPIEFEILLNVVQEYCGT